jgi:hypothetical protein
MRPAISSTGFRRHDRAADSDLRGSALLQIRLASASGGKLGMDVPISLALILASSISVYETIMSGHHAYFDAAVMLCFFLLLGRYLDHRTRAVARSAAEELAALEVPRAVLLVDGVEVVPIADILPGDLGPRPPRRPDAGGWRGDPRRLRTGPLASSPAKACRPGGHRHRRQRGRGQPDRPADRARHGGGARTPACTAWPISSPWPKAPRPATPAWPTAPRGFTRRWCISCRSLPSATGCGPPAAMSAMRSTSLPPC